MVRSACLKSALLALAVISPSSGQPTPLLKVLDDHFVGTWIGVNRTYNQGSPTESAVTIIITRDTKHERLKFKYTYVDNASKRIDHYERTIEFHPSASAVSIDDRDGKIDFQVEGLEQVLRDGYGSFSLHQLARDTDGRNYVYRADYHLTTGSLNYEVYKAQAGAPLTKTGEWITSRHVEAQP